MKEATNNKVINFFLGLILTAMGGAFILANVFWPVVGEVTVGLIGLVAVVLGVIIATPRKELGGVAAAILFIVAVVLYATNVAG